MPHDPGNWRQVPGYPRYHVSDDGRVYSDNRGRCLKPQRNSNGYLHVILCNPDGPKTHVVHRLVLEAFVGPRPSPRHECNHRNADKRDNNASNLEWVTRPENIAHSWRAGLQSPKRGEAHWLAKLTDADVRAIRALRGKAVGAEIARCFGVSQATVLDILRGDTWKHVT